MQSDLLQCVKEQVEYYFSSQNLASDSYLVSRMDAQMFVPLDVILGFAKIQQLTSDGKVILEAIKDSKICVLNEQKTAVKPLLQSKRTTIIIRDIPSSTAECKVRALFDDPEKIQSIRSDVGDTWFITMADSADAVSAVLKLRQNKFNGEPIKARMKSENALNQVIAPMLESVPVAGNRSQLASANMYYANESAYYSVKDFSGAAKDSHHGQRRAGHGNARQTHSTQDRKGYADSDGKKRSSRQVKKKTTSQENAADLTSKNFPPLADVKASLPPCKDGFNGKCIKYDHDDIVEIVKLLGEADCQFEENTINFAMHKVALNERPNLDLLKKQRTYSIEQAREAMRQGRPIRSDSVGSIDYESMMYGEEYTKEVREKRQQETNSSLPSSSEANKMKQQSRNEPQHEPQPSKTGYAAAVLNKNPESSIKQTENWASPSKDKSIQQRADATNSSTSKMPWGDKRSFVEVLQSAKNESPNIE